MLLFALRRTGLACAIIVCAIALLFGMIYLVPGDPANVALGPLATPEIKAAFRAQMGLDRPVTTQFFLFLSHVFTGDLGIDLFSNRRVTTIVFEALPYTMALTACGIGWAIALGVPLGCWSAMHRDSWLDWIHASLLRERLAEDVSLPDPEVDAEEMDLAVRAGDLHTAVHADRHTDRARQQRERGGGERAKATFEMPRTVLRWGSFSFTRRMASIVSTAPPI